MKIGSGQEIRNPRRKKKQHIERLNNLSYDSKKKEKVSKRITK